ncbi:ribonuclease P [Ignicoccus islandicus DSM 13165]|uniref:Ribonuclease P protein component 1 n=1 Tax=Ignicoccus islandicus DSM 13165 TaxID=940295 RepID=A0A0U3DVU4_9CREN|nr:ribonuclease P protein subunit [Ignicoccus islandicus]ALU11562.1 ribonuclease P [Ignicoccus islandicus DSM 13165]
MPKNERNLAYHNVIGLEVEVVEHPDNSLIGLKGIVAMETRNTFLIKSIDGKERRVLKIGYFRFTLPNGRKVLIEGSKIVGRLEERIKRIRKL